MRQKNYEKFLLFVNIGIGEAGQKRVNPQRMQAKIGNITQKLQLCYRWGETLAKSGERPYNEHAK